ncbi:hypothetical protein [Nocardia sp. NPDC005978]|uniref:hypothetical protein n=1 Tax=unclassified Nocardia TaxID=2637762 RepID=UPI0033A36F4F
MTDSLTMAAIETVSRTVNSYAVAAAGKPLPPVTWMWECCARFTVSHTGEPGAAEFCGTIDPDLPSIEAKSHLLQWAQALNMTETTTDRESADGRRSFTCALADSRIRLTAFVESLCPATETQPLAIMS